MIYVIYHVRNHFYFHSDVRNHRVLHRLGVKEQSIPRERNIVEADLAVIVMEGLESRKKRNEDGPAVINHRIVGIDRVADLGIEM